MEAENFAELISSVVFKAIPFMDGWIKKHGGDLLMMAIMRWISEHGHEQQGTIFNYYLNDADRPESDLLTQIVVLIK